MLYEVITRTAASASGLVALALTLAIVLVGRPGLAMIFGDFYGGAYPIIVLLALGQLVAVLAGPCGILLSMTGGQGMLLKATGAATAGILLLGIPATLLFGVITSYSIHYTKLYDCTSGTK